MSGIPKQNVNINFSHGLDTKVDPKQIAIGKFLSLQNTVFDKGGELQKRNGFAQLTSLPNISSVYTTTFNDNLTAIGSSLQAYSQGSKTWVDRGMIQPIELETLPTIRSSLNQSQADVALASNGLICTVYTEDTPVSGSIVPKYKYSVQDSVTGQMIVSPTLIPSGSGTIALAPKVFVLGKYFILLFNNVISAVNHLQYIAVNTNNPTLKTANADISTLYAPASNRSAFDAVEANNNLYIAFNGSDGGGAVRLTYLDSTLTQHNTIIYAGKAATNMSVTADITSLTTTPIIYVSFYDSASTDGYILAVNQQLNAVLAPTKIISTIPNVMNITAAAQSGVATVFYETRKAYSYDAAIYSNFISSRTVTQAGTLGSITVVARSVGLASKAFIVNSVLYVLAHYNSLNQPSYFLINSSGQVISSLANTNGPYGASNGTAYPIGLPSVNVNGSVARMPYLTKDLVQGVNKSQNADNANGVYSQTGVNYATFTFDSANILSAETGGNLNLTGGFLWGYDGVAPVESNFFLYPDYIEVTGSGTGGTMAAQKYFYQVTYEWADNQGNIFRSAPSIPVSVTTTGSTSSVTVNIPTLRLTYKVATPVTLVVYRFSAGQQTYYQATSLTLPTLNDKTVDSLTFVDTLPDSSIVGNNILYTTGGVLENSATPALSVVALWDSRLWGLDAEDGNLAWYSKPVIEATPVEMSPLQTFYVAPTIGAQGSTGKLRAACGMDDKFIFFKKDALYYINGSGPDVTGANNQYSNPIFITSTVGCDNPKSIVFIPNGLMFQSDKGIWLLGRDLSTQYIGAAVQEFTQDAQVLSAVNVPGTNQVRFTLDSGTTLMYDYYYGEWGTFVNVPAVSSTIYQGLHTYINSRGQVYQETPGKYLDGSQPVLMAFKTGWINPAGVQGYLRSYFFTLLGTYLSPHKLAMSIGYDYIDAPSQLTVITPDNYNAPYGYSDGVYGDNSPYGGASNLEKHKIFLDRQRCMAFQIGMNEVFDPSFGTIAGAGLTLSGLNLVVGIKKGYRPYGGVGSSG